MKASELQFFLRIARYHIYVVAEIQTEKSRLRNEYAGQEKDVLAFPR